MSFQKLLAQQKRDVTLGGRFGRSGSHFDVPFGDDDCISEAALKNNFKSGRDKKVLKFVLPDAEIEKVGKRVIPMLICNRWHGFLVGQHIRVCQLLPIGHPLFLELNDKSRCSATWLTV